MDLSSKANLKKTHELAYRIYDYGAPSRRRRMERTILRVEFFPACSAVLISISRQTYTTVITCTRMNLIIVTSGELAS